MRPLSHLLCIVRPLAASARELDAWARPGWRKYGNRLPHADGNAAPPSKGAAPPSSHQAALARPRRRTRSTCPCPPSCRSSCRLVGNLVVRARHGAWGARAAGSKRVKVCTALQLMMYTCKSNKQAGLAALSLAMMGMRRSTVAHAAAEARHARSPSISIGLAEPVGDDGPVGCRQSCCGRLRTSGDYGDPPRYV